MLRVAPRHVASPAFTPPVLVRTRAAVPAPVFTPQRETTIAVRGHLRSGGAAALIVEPAGVCVVSEDRSGRRRVRRVPVREILVVEEHRMARSTELVIVTATSAITVADVDTARAWAFCREVRELILQEGARVEGQGAS